MFASQNIYSPSSAFGHVFLRYGFSSEINHFDLVIDYTADTRGEGGLKYFVNALNEDYKARFNHLSLHEKIKAYNEFEGRDIWQYQLNLNENQVVNSIILAHELKNKQFNYNFFNWLCNTSY